MSEKNITSEWDPILSPKLTEYADIRLNDGMLELRLAKYPDIIIRMDEKAIPKLIKALQRTQPIL